MLQQEQSRYELSSSLRITPKRDGDCHPVCVATSDGVFLSPVIFCCVPRMTSLAFLYIRSFNGTSFVGIEECSRRWQPWQAESATAFVDECRATALAGGIFRGDPRAAVRARCRARAEQRERRRIDRTGRSQGA